ncbi:MaoC/PaaZ C-terminal domain-containing protein [Candidatus Pelagibacter sp. RS39]|uniref:MaoC/PaaZ C-terminal domain-containing protein n=1 Tax=Candidatus Pelagibacter sp. RS39 TaxID=1977864 RepID=UPI000A163B32|nr:MaoC/PaaZ C-terminal domain-containing protein [Candidatus Pelagibacter sp. RS39]ARJ47471.1 hypothetical protein B5L73_01390 [Candidatus Pelagibacter sp. RS39]
MSNFLEKKFSLNKCKNFSKLSGDKNPLHLDKKLSNYSQFQKPIVQGIQVLMYIFEKSLIKKITKNSNSISVVFKNPIFIDEKIIFKIRKEKKNIIVIAKNLFQEKIIITFEILSESEKEIFNTNTIIKNLLTLTKYVGNFRNNLNIISTLDIKKNDKKNYKKVIKLSKNFYKFEHGLNDISLKSYFVSFKKKIEEKFDKKSKIKINKNFFENKKILIIGGSSGLGRVLINYFLSNKILIDFTYNKNSRKLDFIKKKYKVPNKRIFKLNNLNLNLYKKKLSKYDIFYFFPTSKIFSFNEKFFDYKKFDNFNLINIDFLLKIFKFIGNSEEKKFFYVPSSKLAGENVMSSEYGLSKNLQEKILKRIKKLFKNIKISNPRLDSYFTESTKGLINNNSDYDKFIKSAIEF